MNTNYNRQPHCLWHYSSEFLREANTRGCGKLLTPELIQWAQRVYQESDGMPAPFASGVESLGDGRFDLAKSVEVVPLSIYTDSGDAGRDLRLRYGIDAVHEIACNGQDVVGLKWLSGADLTEGLEHVATMVECGGIYYPMLVIDVRGE